MNLKEIEQHVALLLTSIQMRADIQLLAKGAMKILLVEGKTDEEFIKPLLNPDIVCIVANKAFGNFSNLNCKKAIVQVILGMTQYRPLLQISPKFANMQILGMIDLDYDKVTNYSNIPGLFVMDTHDLETLIISTNKDVFYRLNECVISRENVEMSLWTAYQMGVIRRVLREEIKGLDLTPISSDLNKKLQYSQFVENGAIDIRKMIHYISMGNTPALPKEKERQIYNMVSKSKKIRKLVDADGQWSKRWNEYSAEQFTDFWETVQGHEILSLLRYYNPEVAEKYFCSTHALNRKLEYELIHNYDYSTMTSTKIYKQMRSAGVIGSIV